MHFRILGSKMSSWKRPKDVPYPSVWARFQGKVSDNGEPPLWYTIQDVPEHLFEDVVQHMTKYFVVREKVFSSCGLAEDPVSLAEVQARWREMLNDRMCIVALVDGDEEDSRRIAGVNMLSALTREEVKKENELKGKISKRLMYIFEDLYNREDLFEKYKVDVCLSAMGLSVATHYQGDNVGYQLLMARTPLCQATGIHLMVTLYSCPAAIHEAFKAGFKLLQYEPFNSYSVNGKLLFPRLSGQLILTGKTIPKSPDK